MIHIVDLLAGRRNHWYIIHLIQWFSNPGINRNLSCWNEPWSRDRDSGANLVAARLKELDNLREAPKSHLDLPAILLHHTSQELLCEESIKKSYAAGEMALRTCQSFRPSGVTTELRLIPRPN
jgi:hypothetical protein